MDKLPVVQVRHIPTCFSVLCYICWLTNILDQLMDLYSNWSFLLHPVFSVSGGKKLFTENSNVLTLKMIPTIYMNGHEDVTVVSCWPQHCVPPSGSLSSNQSAEQTDYFDVRCQSHSKWCLYLRWFVSKRSSFILHILYVVVIITTTCECVCI